MDTNVIKKQGFVAMLDILGFADRVARDAEVHGLDKYIKTVVALSDRYDNLGSILFSDTVVLFTFDDGQRAFEDIISLVSILSFSLLMEEVPLRGAIAHGIFVRSEQQAHGTVIAGRPILEAHYYESQMQWVGVTLAPSVIRIVPHVASTYIPPRHEGESQGIYLNRIRFKARIQNCRVPFESSSADPGGEFEGLGIVPFDTPNSVEEMNKSITTVLSKLNWLKQAAPDPRSQRKYRQSIEWLRGVMRTWTLR
jgi:hypothetical protein